MFFGRKILRFVVWLLGCFLLSSVGLTLLYKWMPVPVTPLMLIRCAQQWQRGESLKLSHTWVRLADMSPHLSRAVMASEDQRFLMHHGFDFHEISNAVKERVSGKRVRGGSTISQQTAKNVFLWPTSSWTRKGFEVFFTCLIELCWGKERIMEVYLNSIEMGNGIYGAEAVARHHFATTAACLTRSQCALIAATLPNPLKYDSSAPSKYVRRRSLTILSQMKNMKSLPAASGSSQKND